MIHTLVLTAVCVLLAVNALMLFRWETNRVRVILLRKKVISLQQSLNCANPMVLNGPEWNEHFDFMGKPFMYVRKDVDLEA